MLPLYTHQIPVSNKRFCIWLFLLLPFSLFLFL